MAKIKHTKNELKTQRDALTRFERYLPMLQLKKQQLQVEIQAITARIAELDAERDKLNAGLNAWIKLMSEPVGIEEMVQLEKVYIEEGNIAGVAIPLLKDVDVAVAEADLFSTPPWLDEASEVLGSLISLRVKIEILEEQRSRIQEELRVTTQRVNLFEKVKIPECRENIRVIRIFLGDEQTAAVARAKLAKGRLTAEAMAA